MEDGVIEISELKTGQQFTLDFNGRDVIFTKLEEAQKFNIEDWFPDETEIYIMESRIEEDEPLHYAFEPMTLEEGQRRNHGKFGKDLVMYDFLGHEVEGIEMADEEEAEETEE